MTRAVLLTVLTVALFAAQAWAAWLLPLRRYFPVIVISFLLFSLGVFGTTR